MVTPSSHHGDLFANVDSKNGDTMTSLLKVIHVILPNVKMFAFIVKYLSSCCGYKHDYFKTKDILGHFVLFYNVPSVCFFVFSCFFSNYFLQSFNKYYNLKALVHLPVDIILYMLYIMQRII